MSTRPLRKDSPEAVEIDLLELVLEETESRARARRPRTEATPAPRCEAVDGRLVVELAQDVEIRCGAASILLTQSGKILIRGTHVCTRSSGLNKILGASVRIN